MSYLSMKFLNIKTLIDNIFCLTFVHKILETLINIYDYLKSFKQKYDIFYDHLFLLILYIDNH
jgi:hypothetical protein